MNLGQLNRRQKNFKLLQAAYAENENEVLALCSAGADVNEALHFAAECLVLETMCSDDLGEYLAKAARFYDDILPESCVGIWGTSLPDNNKPIDEMCEEVVKILIKKFGANVNAMNNQGMTLLLYFTDAWWRTSSYVCLFMIDTLIELGADVTVVNENGWTLLDFFDDRHITLIDAYGPNDIRTIRILIKLGTDVNSVFGGGNTLLHFAAQRGDMDMVTMLVEEWGADMTIKNENGRSALSLACDFGHQDIAFYLRKKVSEL